MGKDMKKIMEKLGIASQHIGHGLWMVLWEDSNYRTGWTRGEVDGRALRIVSIGFMCHKDKDSITLSANMSIEDDQQRCGDMTIPTRCVVRMERLG